MARGAAVNAFHASAPVRLDFAGGWTDVAPFAVNAGGSVVNAAIELRAHATITLGGTCYRLAAEDLGQTVEVASLEPDGELSLHKAALRRGGLGPCELRTCSDAPAGSGLGSSGALGVALVRAIDAARGVERSASETAEEAWQVEAIDAELAGGRQDQYAAALGGFHHLRFSAVGVRAEPIPLDHAFRATLGEHTVICYTGASRVSSRVIARVMQGYAQGHSAITGALRGLAEMADPMAAALLRRDLSDIGRLLTTNWGWQTALDPGMRTTDMARLEDMMRAAGAIGGKAAGAGAGGCMFFLCEDPAKGRAAARAAGATMLPCVWATEGVRAWRA